MFHRHKAWAAGVAAAVTMCKPRLPVQSVDGRRHVPTTSGVHAGAGRSAEGEFHGIPGRIRVGIMISQKSIEGRLEILVAVVAPVSYTPASDSTHSLGPT